MAELLTPRATTPDRLGAFLERMATQRFVDGHHDCVLTVADWVLACTDHDPAAPFRGRYRTALGRERLLRRLGGIDVVMRDGAGRAGLQVTDDPRPGDVGLILHRGQTLAAICIGSTWAVQSSVGLTALAPDRVLTAWSVPHG